MHPVEIDDADGNSNQESTEEPRSVYGWVICKVVSLEGKVSLKNKMKKIRFLYIFNLFRFFSYLISLEKNFHNEMSKNYKYYNSNI